MKGFLPRTLHPGLQILLLLVTMGAGFCVGLFLVGLLGQPLFGMTIADVPAATARPTQFPSAWGFFNFYQGIIMLTALAGGALLLASALGYGWAEYFSPRRLGAAWWLLVTALLIIVTLPFMSTLIAWNAGAHFPAALHDFEAWARDSEDRLAGLTKFLTRFNSAGRFAVGVLVIALVPAVSEELVFRGVIQKNLVRWFSPHVGVWLGAALFSAIHFQFFGFVPRFVLGLVLGYLYLWSGNILVSMAAHFTQNAFQLFILFLTQRGQFGWGFDPDSNEALPWTLAVPSAVLSIGLLYFLHQRLTAPTPPTEMLTLSSDGVKRTA
ncbi:CPBP family intramembrane glutamic endopeptidase [Hymenobacter daeguensis]